MKSPLKRSASLSVFILMILCCNVSAQNEKTDSLVKINWLNEKAIQITYGSDAVTAIQTQKGILVIDAGICTGLATQYRNIMEKEFSGSHFAYLINTHAHFDHCGGNPVFEDAVIIGHANCGEELRKSRIDTLKMMTSLQQIIREYEQAFDTAVSGSKERYEALCQKTRYGCALNDLANNILIGGWDQSFSDTMTLPMGDITAYLIWFGNAHSSTDIVIHIPELKLLFTGDLFSLYGRPSLGKYTENDKIRWYLVLDWLFSRKEQIETIVGGHGQMMGWEDIKSFRKRIENL